MAHTAAARKALRQTKKHTYRNRRVKERLKDLVKRLQGMLAEQKNEEAQALLPKFMQALDKAAKEKIIHRNRANRLKSAWMKRLSVKEK